MHSGFVGKAVFASCPHESSCTENEKLYLPENGGSVSFNATMIHIGGGSCGYQQNISLIRLAKKNETTGMFDVLLHLCYTSDMDSGGRCGPFDGHPVSLSRGRTDFEFMLTLSNVTADNIGMYEVMVARIDPRDGTEHAIIFKRFRLLGK